MHRLRVPRRCNTTRPVNNRKRTGPRRSEAVAGRVRRRTCCASATWVRSAKIRRVALTCAQARTAGAPPGCGHRSLAAAHFRFTMSNSASLSPSRPIPKRRGGRSRRARMEDHNIHAKCSQVQNVAKNHSCRRARACPHKSTGLIRSLDGGSAPAAARKRTSCEVRVLPQAGIGADKTARPPLSAQAGTQHFLTWPGRNPCDRIATVKCQFGYTWSNP
jgi:hypothetical protein